MDILMLFGNSDESFSILHSRHCLIRAVTVREREHCCLLTRDNIS